MKFNFKKFIITTVITLSISAVTVPAIITATPAHASGGTQVCTARGSTLACTNAWFGGPFVNVEETGGLANNNFYVYLTGDGYDAIQYEGGGTWGGYCIGDAYNNSNYANTSLDGCPGPQGSGNNGGWGVNFTDQSCTLNGESGIAFHNNHWGGYLAPANNFGNGSPFYLNGPFTCFTFTTF